jgi:hypothetical protein
MSAVTSADASVTPAPCRASDRSEPDAAPACFGRWESQWPFTSPRSAASRVRDGSGARPGRQSRCVHGRVPHPPHPGYSLLAKLATRRLAHSSSPNAQTRSPRLCTSRFRRLGFPPCCCRILVPEQHGG